MDTKEKKSYFFKLKARLARIYKIVLYRIGSDLCFLRASALTYQSLLAIVPLLAVMFGIAKGFGIERLLETILRSEFHDQEQVLSYYIQFSYSLLAQAQGGIIAGIGIIVLLVTVMRLFANIEDALNYMWGVKVSRSLARQASDYLALILICPILIAASSSMTLFVRTNIERLVQQAGPSILYVIAALPYLVSALLFTLVYIVMPNTRVRFRSALWAGIFAGCAYQILQATYITIQIKITNTGAIYGSFAALPLFLLWLYVSWLIFLIGGQVMVIHQERLWDPEILASYRKLTLFEQELLGLSCVKAAVDSFLEGKPITLSGIASLLKLPERDVAELVQDLMHAGLVYKVVSPVNGELAIVTAKNPDEIRMFDVLKQVEGTNTLTSPHIVHFEKLVKEAQKEFDRSSKNLLLKDIHL